MPSETRLCTVEDVRAMPDDGNRYETVAGELLVTPAPSLRHQAVLGELYLRLQTYVKQHRLGRIWFAPVDVLLGPLTLVEPDLLFVRSEHRDILNEHEVVGAPDLALEVVSAFTWHTDRGRKRALYQEAGVAEYWVVDPELKQVEVWRPGALAAAVMKDTIRWQPDPRVEPLLVKLRDIFEN